MAGIKIYFVFSTFLFELFNSEPTIPPMKKMGILVMVRYIIDHFPI